MIGDKDLNLENSFKYIDSLIQKGYRFEFDTVNQIENGMLNDDGTDNGNGQFPLYTVTSYVYGPSKKSDIRDCDPIEKYIASFDTLEQMYLWLAWQMKGDGLGK